MKLKVLIFLLVVLFFFSLSFNKTLSQDFPEKVFFVDEKYSFSLSNFSNTKNMKPALSGQGMEPKFVPREFIVKLKDSVSTHQHITPISTGIDSMDELNQRFNVLSVEKVLRTIIDTKTSKIAGRTKIPNLSNIYKLKVEEDADIPSIVKEYEKDPLVEWAEPNYIYKASVTPNDPGLFSQWGLSKISASQSWDIERGNSSIVIAIVDTGVAWDHPDLANNIWNNTNEIPNNGIDDDGNGYVDDVRGWDFVNSDNDPMDDFGHGTHTAGIAAAVTNNSIGIAGLCWNCKIMAVKALDNNGEGSEADLANAITYAANNNANIISMSWGSSESSNLIKSAIDYAYDKGVVLVAAAGNDYSDFKTYPAGYDNVIPVGATDSSDTKASFSNYGSWVDVAAPGVDINSTVPTGSCELCDSTGYTYLSGTSMATPFVAGLAGLILSKNSSFNPEEIRSIIKSSTDNVSFDEYIGIGRINASKAIQINSIAVAQLNSYLDDATVSGVIKINGTANGTTFQNYILYYGQGVYPTSWTIISSSHTSVNDDLLTDWDTTLMSDGIYTIRLLVNNTQNFISEDRIVLTIRNVNIISPEDNDFFGKENITINGSVNVSNFKNYTVDYTNATDPTIWTVINYSTVQINGTLTIWNTADVISGKYVIRLRVYRTDSTLDQANVTVIIDRSMLEGWPKKFENWKSCNGFFCVTLTVMSPTVADVNGDGFYEVLLGSANKSDSSKGQVYIYQYNGTLLPGWPQVTNGAPQTVIAVGDIDNDGQKEVITGTTGFGASLYVWKNNGTLEPGWPKSLDYSIASYCIVLEDVDNDNFLDIIFTTGDKKVWVMDYHGNNLTGWPRDIQDYPFYSCPAVFDNEGDGYKEIFVSGYNTCCVSCNTTIYGFNYTGEALAGWPQTILGNCSYGSPVVGDLGNNGDLEIAIPAWNLDSNECYVHVYRTNGQVATGWPKVIENQAGFDSPLALGDVDNDQKIEIVAGTRNPHGRINVWKEDGSNAPGWPVSPLPADAPFKNILSPSIGDTTGAGNQSIVVGADTGSPLPDFIYAYYNNGTLIPNWPRELVGETSGLIPPILSDLDNDGNIEIIFLDFIFSERIYVWHLNGTYNPQDIEWGQFHHDERHTGLYRNPKLLPKATNFNGRTTEFMFVKNISTVYNATLEKINYGKIEFGNQPINFSSANLDEYVNISYNLLSVNTTEIPNLNKSANLTLYSLTFISPKILRDGSDCPSSICRIINYSNGNLIFSVTQFSIYSATETAYCGDGTCSNGETCSSCPQDCGTCSSGRTGTVGGVTGLIEETKFIPEITPTSPTTIAINRSADLKIENITIGVNNKVSNVRITVKESSKPAGAPEPIASITGKTYKYLEITKLNIKDEDMTKVEIVFKIDNDWISTNKIDEDKVHLDRYINDTWSNLETSKLYKDSNYTHYKSESLGLSVFAITGDITSLPVCGNGKCEQGENYNNCCLDCSCPSGQSCDATTKTCYSQLALECQSCPEPAAWSDCTNGIQKRANYRCSENTGYKCEGYEEARDCTNFSIWLVVGIIGVGIITLISVMFWAKRRAKVPEVSAPPSELSPAELPSEFIERLEKIKTEIEKLKVIGIDITECEKEIEFAENALRNGLKDMAMLHLDEVEKILERIKHTHS